MNRQDTKSAKEEPDQILDALAHRVIGSAIEVHRELGPGYLESVYEAAMAVELEAQRIAFVRQLAFTVPYKTQKIGEDRIDFLIEGCLIVELKAVDKLVPIHTAQVISYLKATGCVLGLLINFNERLLRSGIQRVILS